MKIKDLFEVRTNSVSNLFKTEIIIYQKLIIRILKKLENCSKYITHIIFPKVLAT